MAGKFLTNKNIDFIQNWLNDIYKTNNWEGNNLHIDEIRSFKKNTSFEWLNFSILLLNNVKQKLKLNNKLILFLHIDLKYDSTKLCLKDLELEWLEENMNEFTPPSLNLTSRQYFDDFYKYELTSCNPCRNLSIKLNNNKDLNFFYRSYFDFEEDLHSREIYIFINT